MVMVIKHKDRGVPVHAMKERYSSAHCLPWYLMDVSGGHHAKAVLYPVSIW